MKLTVLSEQQQTRLFHGLKSVHHIKSVLEHGLLPGGTEEAVCLAPKLEGAYDYRAYHGEPTYAIVEVLAPSRSPDYRYYSEGEDEVQIPHTIGLTGLPRITAIYIIGDNGKRIIDIPYDGGAAYKVGQRLKKPTRDDIVWAMADQSFPILARGDTFQFSGFAYIPDQDRDGPAIAVKALSGYEPVGDVLVRYPFSVDGLARAIWGRWGYSGRQLQPRQPQ